MMLLYSTAALLCGFAFDIITGDPEGWPHIVRGFGALISFLEKRLYPLPQKRLGGAILAFITLFLCTGLPAALLFFAWRLSSWAYFTLETLLIWQLLATKSLKKESRRVYDALVKGDVAAARRALSMIVGRDTAALDAAGVTRAAVETVAENTSDGVAAPLFYIMLGGGVLGCFYKAANTLDSMIGYKNGRYLDFGRCAAKLDDILNYLPSRLCALIMLLATVLCGLDSKNARRIWKRDRRKHESPNSAQTESVMAGALGVRLAGDAYYFGVLHKKPHLGDDLRPITPGDILQAHTLLYYTAALMLILSIFIRWCIYAAI